MSDEDLEEEATEVYLQCDRDFMHCQDEGEVFTWGYLAGAKAHLTNEEHKSEAESKAKAIQEIKSKANHKSKLDKIRHYLNYEIPLDLCNEATDKIRKICYE